MVARAALLLPAAVLLVGLVAVLCFVRIGGYLGRHRPGAARHEPASPGGPSRVADPAGPHAVGAGPDDGRADGTGAGPGDGTTGAQPADRPRVPAGAAPTIVR